MNKKDSLKEIYINCKSCGEYGFGPAFSKGTGEEKIMFVGSSPFMERENEAFTGKSGEIISALLELTDIKKEEIYFTYLVKCFPKTKTDFGEKCEKCIVHLREETRIIRPKIIVCFGENTAKRLIKKDYNPIFDRGKAFKKGGIIFFGTKEPSALFNNPKERTISFSDFKNIKSAYDKIF